jgi:hypothetical protein
VWPPSRAPFGADPGWGAPGRQAPGAPAAHSASSPLRAGSGLARCRCVTTQAVRSAAPRQDGVRGPLVNVEAPLRCLPSNRREVLPAFVRSAGILSSSSVTVASLPARPPAGSNTACNASPSLVSMALLFPATVARLPSATWGRVMNAPRGDGSTSLKPVLDFLAGNFRVLPPEARAFDRRSDDASRHVTFRDAGCGQRQVREAVSTPPLFLASSPTPAVESEGRRKLATLQAIATPNGRGAGGQAH